MWGATRIMPRHSPDVADAKMAAVKRFGSFDEGSLRNPAATGRAFTIGRRGESPKFGALLRRRPHSQRAQDGAAVADRLTAGVA